MSVQIGTPLAALQLGRNFGFVPSNGSFGMLKLLSITAGLSFFAIGPASAETILTFNFSGMVEDNGKPTGTTATATGRFVFDQTGNNLTPEYAGGSITGIPQSSGPYHFCCDTYTVWNIAPDGSVLSGLYELGDGSSVGEADFTISYNYFSSGHSHGYFGYYPDALSLDSFSSDNVSFTQTGPSSVPEPKSLAIFATGLVGLAITRVKAIQDKSATAA